MGADFISYCVFGPTKLSTSKKVFKKAEKRFTEYVKLACELDELVKQACDSSKPREVADAADARVKELLNKHCIDCTDDVTWATEYKDKPVQLIDDLFDVWHNCSRDSSYRTLPGNKQRKVWYAGDMSWGDEPDGFGYLTMKRVDMAGLLDIFGLE